MGLKEKRRLQELQTGLMPSLKKDLQHLCGVEIEWDVDWDSFAGSMEALDNIEHQGLRRIYSVFLDVCRDDLGKKCVRESVQRICVKNLSEAADKKIEFADKTLRVYGAWGAGWGGYPQESEIKDKLETAL